MSVNVPTVLEVIGLIDVRLLKTACPERGLSELEQWVKPFQDVCKKYDIHSIRRVSAFLAQTAHESGLITGREENLNYSTQGLADQWPGRFAVNPKVRPRIPNAKAKAIARNPEAIGNAAYSNRLGNGDEASGDGWFYRGGGIGQLTGKDNWANFGASVGLNSIKARAYGRTLEGGLMSFAWFWKTNNLNLLAETPGVEDETIKINGGTNGLADRRARFDNVVAELLRRLRALKGK